jgi:catechol 2,3-dioxygenase-like lactoylglutathione lyase family enzyme
VEPIIDHIQITVKDMSVAEPFYDKLLPLLGFDLRHKRGAVIEEHEFHVVEYVHPRLAFAITSPRRAFVGDAVHRRKPGALHHIAFKVGSRDEVDRLHSGLKGTGATIVSAPREYPEYVPPGYYALFFKDLEGIKYEIVCHDHADASRSSEQLGASRVTPSAGRTEGIP